jgi:hypothetical protein
MVRLGPWKLVYYHGMEPQLFNLADDPGEMDDRAADLGCRSVRDELTARVLNGWNPDAIAAVMAQKRAENALLTQWAKCVQPPDQYRWPLRGEMNRLDDWPG